MVAVHRHRRTVRTDRAQRARLVAAAVATLAALAATVTVGALGAAPAGAAPVPFLSHFSSVSVVGSTVPSNGDVNPYGVATVPFSTGTLVRGDTLVSNFNSSNNLQGTGTTIVQVAPNGQVEPLRPDQSEPAGVPRRRGPDHGAQRPRRRLCRRRQPAGDQRRERDARGRVPHRPQQQRRAGRDLGRQRHQRALGHDVGASVRAVRRAVRHERAQRHGGRRGQRGRPRHGAAAQRLRSAGSPARPLRVDDDRHGLRRGAQLECAGARPDRRRARPRRDALRRRYGAQSHCRRAVRDEPLLPRLRRRLHPQRGWQPQRAARARRWRPTAT